MRFWIGARNAIIPALILWAIIISSCNYAFASGECNGHGNCTETITEIGVETSVGGDEIVNSISSGGNRTLALGNSLGDVDIAQCLGSEQWNTPLFGKQKLVINWPCMAEFYLRNGKFQLAAMAVCNTEIEKEFASEAECEAAHDFTHLAVAPPEPEAHVPEEVFYRQEQLHNEQLEQLSARIEQLEKKPTPRPRPAAPQIVQQPLLTDQKRAALESLLEKDEDQ